MAKAQNNNKNLLLAVVAVIVVVAGGWVVLSMFGGSGGGSRGGFEPDPNYDAEALRGQIEELSDNGRQHVTTKVDYGEDFPASGNHAPSPMLPGFYEDLIIMEALVHSLEHGHIVIFYDDPGADVLTQIRNWTIRYQGYWDGVLAVPHDGLGSEIVMSAWTRRLRMAEFSADGAWIFIDDFRGRGPENSVR